MNPDATLLLTGFVAAMLILLLLGLQWVNSPGRWIKRHIERIEAGGRMAIPERSEWDREIIVDSEGFAVVPLSDPSESRSFLGWDSIVDATAFKRDLLSTDQVCIAFLAADGSGIEVHEEMKGWRDLCAALPKFLPGAPPWEDWFMAITTPAFEPCPRSLFRRNGSA